MVMALVSREEMETEATFTLFVAGSHFTGDSPFCLPFLFEHYWRAVYLWGLCIYFGHPPSQTVPTNFPPEITLGRTHEMEMMTMVSFLFWDFFFFCESVTANRLHSLCVPCQLNEKSKNQGDILFAGRWKEKKRLQRREKNVSNPSQTRALGYPCLSCISMLLAR